VTPQPHHVHTVDSEALKAGLERLGVGTVELRETHISWVFLVGERAYKLKKPLVLPFLDYGTPERRREMCREEVRLNSRLAPEIYLGVRGVAPIPGGIELTGEQDPRAIDFVVEMCRYDEQRTLAAKLDTGELNGSEVIALAQTLARFHARCRRAGDVRSGARWIEREVDRNGQELLGVAEHRRERERIRTLARFAAAFVASRWGELDARAERGLIRDCHGDLRAEHVILGPPISVVDCVEFDPGLRKLDIADDLAFLLMDLTALGHGRFAGELVDAYRTAGGDPGDDSLLSFFAAHRALVREKVQLVRASQRSRNSRKRGHASAHGHELLTLAERFSWRARLPLVLVICGVPASGKSHLASTLAHASGLPLLSSDLVRKGLAGIAPSRPASPEHYGEEFNRSTYAELGRRAAAEREAHGGVLVDATFRHRRDRDAFAHAFSGAAPLLFVECVVPAAVLARRAISRERDPARVSDATLPIVLREQAAWDPLDEVAAGAHVPLRTDRPVHSIVADLLGLLDERL
jgi:aminoglycoside phosphotransferase family enzyme/predicted kinase